MFTAHCVLFNVYCYVSCILFIAQCTLFNLHFFIYTVHCALFTVHCSMCTAHCTLARDYLGSPSRIVSYGRYVASVTQEFRSTLPKKIYPAPIPPYFTNFGCEQISIGIKSPFKFSCYFRVQIDLFLPASWLRHRNRPNTWFGVLSNWRLFSKQ